MEVQWSDGLEILFIGNSITYWNDLPSIVAALVDSAGIEVDSVASSAKGGFSLADHWAFERAQVMIASNDWDVVVLQGYTGIGESRDSLLKYVELFAYEASLVGARTALFMRNPGDTYREYVDEIAAAYTVAARQNNAVLLPVAVAWEEVWRRDSEFELYDDGVHPNKAGSYLAALVIHQHLTGQSPIGLPATLRLDRGWFPELFELAAGDAEFLQEVAATIGAPN